LAICLHCCKLMQAYLFKGGPDACMCCACGWHAGRQLESSLPYYESRVHTVLHLAWRKARISSADLLVQSSAQQGNLPPTYYRSSASLIRARLSWERKGKAVESMIMTLLTQWRHHLSLYYKKDNGSVGDRQQQKFIMMHNQTWYTCKHCAVIPALLHPCRNVLWV